MSQLFDLFLHVDKHLLQLIADTGAWTYAILFAVIFCETGLIVTPFLPGDSLLFAAGALTVATGAVDASGAPQAGLSLAMLLPLLIGAAVLGNTTNYFIARMLGPAFLESGKLRFVKRSYIEQTQAFYERHGGKTVVLARFAPILRTIAPFVAGIGKMPFARFSAYNVVGAVAWVCLCTFAGVWFGNIEIVRKNFGLVAIGIVVVSALPTVIGVLRERMRAKG